MALSVDITENWKLLYLKRNWIPVQWAKSYGTVAQFNCPSNIDSVNTMGNEAHQIKIWNYLKCKKLDERNFTLIFFPKHNLKNENIMNR